MKLFTMTKTVIKHLFIGPSTLMYPAKPRIYTDITRGKIEIKIEACIFCGQCSRKCPSQAITVTKEQREWEINSLNCIACGYCVEVCPVKCLSMNNHYSPAVTLRSAAISKFKGSQKPAPVQNSSQ